jgi:hypothetical protein
MSLFIFCVTIVSFLSCGNIDAFFCYFIMAMQALSLRSSSSSFPTIFFEFQICMSCECVIELPYFPFEFQTCKEVSRIV